MRRVTAPGNLLLVGEYAVLEEGGIGVACAAGPRAVVTGRPADDLIVETDMGGSGLIRYSRKEMTRDNLVGSVFSAVEAWRKQKGLNSPVTGRYTVDSGAFFDANGGKKGFGSSAAVSVALAGALAEPELRAGTGGAADEVFAIALAAHRAFQGGVGSGYDVAASCYGGWGLFRGGVAPSWTPLPLARLPRVKLGRGSAPVRTRSAVHAYLEWKANHADEAHIFLDQTREAVMTVVTAKTWEEALASLRTLADLARSLGDAVGVPARVPESIAATAPEAHSLCKALGAGDELFGLLLPPEDAQGENEPPTTVVAGIWVDSACSQPGITWE